MTVFRGYLLIIKRNWGFIFIYTALFLLTMLIIQGETQKKEEKEFQRSRLKIAVVDEDGGILAEGLTNYLATLHEITEIGNAEGTLLEANKNTGICRIGLFETADQFVSESSAVLYRKWVFHAGSICACKPTVGREIGQTFKSQWESGEMGILLLYFSFPSIPFHCSIVSDLKYSDECIPEERNQTAAAMFCSFSASPDGGSNACISSCRDYFLGSDDRSCHNFFKK